MVTPAQLITPAELVAHLDDPEVILIDCRFNLTQPDWGRQQYHQSHIPGAVYLDLNRDLSGPVSATSGRHPLPDIPTFVAKLVALGLTPAKLVIAYDQGQLAYAARLWWLLRYVGHERVALLAGGWEAYIRAGYPTSSDRPAPHPGQFTPHLQPQYLATYADVVAAQQDPTVLLVDAREARRYRGEWEP
ncbi:MAG: rhodanese-like domain-containing protein, partial [Gloeomargarita sp. GMQP_bins_5]